MVELARREGVRRYLEIGLYAGDTLHFVVSQLDTTFACGVTLPTDLDDAAAHAYLEAAHQDLAARGYDVRVIYGDSHDLAIIEKVRALGGFDLVLIDGDHSPSGVRVDWENYGPMGRLVALHDIDSAFVSDYGVTSLWQELKIHYKHEEIIGEYRGMGIGVIYR